MEQGIEVVAFDTFGTVVDWHTGVSEALARIFPDLNPGMLANQWRARYQPALDEVESGRRPWTRLDELHREELDRILIAEYGIHASDEELDEAVRAWHLLPAWPDSVGGLGRIKRRHVVAALSNGPVALLTRMARYAGLPWDVIAGSDLWGHYKPSTTVYLGLAELLEVEPGQVLMVATHSDDLRAARSCGLLTAYVERPKEFGDLPKEDGTSREDTFHAHDLEDLADQLGC